MFICIKQHSTAQFVLPQNAKAFKKAIHNTNYHILPNTIITFTKKKKSIALRCENWDELKPKGDDFKLITSLEEENIDVLPFQG